MSENSGYPYLKIPEEELKTNRDQFFAKERLLTSDPCNFPVVEPRQFYSELFNGGVDLQKRGEDHDGKGNVIVISKNVKTEKYTRSFIHPDNNFEDIVNLPPLAFSFLSPISYFGKSRSLKNARFMYAMAFDVDEVKYQNLRVLLGQIESQLLPRPTYIVNSGNGLHLYYKFVTPVPMVPTMQKALQQIKHSLTRQLWNPHVTSKKKVEYQSINQGFRVVGGFTKEMLRSPQGDIKSKLTVKAFRTGEEVTLEYLYNHIWGKDDWFDLDELCQYHSTCTINQAKEKYPEWYQKRIVEQRQPGQWQVKDDLYKWWIRQVETGDVSYGHRYWCLYVLSAFAVKCGISEEQLRKDCYALRPKLNDINDDQPFTKADVESALRCYKDKIVASKLTRKWLSEKAAIPMTPNKRNGRTQAIHLKRIRVLQDVDYPNGEWRNKNGRPVGTNKQEIVQNWKAEHPNGKKIECFRDTKLSRVTIDKWWWN